MSLLGELKRRNVMRVGVAYLVLAWVLLQVGDVVFEALNLDNAANTLLLAILALGLAPALIFAWVFELTPEGLKKDSGPGQPTPASHETAKKLDIAVIVMVLVGIGLLAADRFIQRGESMPGATSVSGQAPAEQDSEQPRHRSIAVLPFADLSPEGDQAYFADGISEELLNVLARIDDLKVAARTSSFKFRDGDADVAEIGAALNVATVLEGSIRKAGDDIRITAQLIDARDGYHLWSETYDRRLENIFAVQDEIAAAIVSALRLELNLDHQSSSRTSNMEAYNLYLRAQEQAREPSREQLLEAVALYEQALRIDPDYAAAWGGIADAWIWLEDYGGFKSSVAYPRAEQAARRAIELDPNSAEGHAAMALVQDRYYSDMAEARKYFERTIELNPNDASIYNAYADSLGDLGEQKRAIAMRRRAVELDPLSPFFRSRLASTLANTSQFAEAREIIDEILAQDPNNDYGLEERANLRYWQGQLAKASQDYLQVHNLRAGDPYSAAFLAQIGLEVDDPAMARYWVEESRSRGADNRWELLARHFVNIYHGDWDALASTGALLGGSSGAASRGWALIHQEKFNEARQAFLTSLRLTGYVENSQLAVPMIEPLMGLAWLDKKEGLETWKERVGTLEPLLSRLHQQQVFKLINRFRVEEILAQVAALRGDRAVALQHLRALVDAGWGFHWFLQRDPFFAPWQDDPEFQALVATMKQTAAHKRERLPDQVLSP